VAAVPFRLVDRPVVRLVERWSDRWSDRWSGGSWERPARAVRHGCSEGPEV